MECYPVAEACVDEALEIKDFPECIRDKMVERGKDREDKTYLLPSR